MAHITEATAAPLAHPGVGAEESTVAGAAPEGHAFDGAVGHALHYGAVDELMHHDWHVLPLHKEGGAPPTEAELEAAVAEHCLGNFTDRTHLRKRVEVVHKGGTIGFTEACSLVAHTLVALPFALMHKGCGPVGDCCTVKKAQLKAKIDSWNEPAKPQPALSGGAGGAEGGGEAAAAAQLAAEPKAPAAVAAAAAPAGTLGPAGQALAFGGPADAAAATGPPAAGALSAAPKALPKVPAKPSVGGGSTSTKAKYAQSVIGVSSTGGGLGGKVQKRSSAGGSSQRDEGGGGSEQGSEQGSARVPPGGGSSSKPRSSSSSKQPGASKTVVSSSSAFNSGSAVSGLLGPMVMNQPKKKAGGGRKSQDDAKSVV